RPDRPHLRGHRPPHTVGLAHREEERGGQSAPASFSSLRWGEVESDRHGGAMLRMDDRFRVRGRHPVSAYASTRMVNPPIDIFLKSNGIDFWSMPARRLSFITFVFTWSRCAFER